MDQLATADAKRSSFTAFEDDSSGHEAGLTVWQRIIIALIVLIGLSVAGFCIWVVGILMFTFALDGANGQQLADWLDLFMLVGWPISIVLAVLIPPAAIACGAKWWQILMSLAFTAGICVASYLAGVIALITSL